MLARCPQAFANEDRRASTRGDCRPSGYRAPYTLNSRTAHVPGRAIVV